MTGAALHDWRPSAGLLEVLASAQEIGAIGGAPLAEHVTHARAFAEAFPPGPAPRHLLDLGSGGGLPGLVLAELLPETAVALLDGRTERGRFLADAVDRLGLTARVRVLSARAEDAGHDADLRGTFDAVVARGFAAPAVTAECAAPFLGTGGILVVSEPPDAVGASRWPAPGCATLGLVFFAAVRTPYGFAVLRQVTPCPDRFPRRVGVPAKRPLF